MEDLFDFSRTQRIVLLIDLHPLFDPRNPNHDNYVESIVASARAVFNFEPLSSSLFAFKLFFSSLSPVLSSSKVHSLVGKSPDSLSFDRPSQTLNSLIETLNLVAPCDGKQIGSPKAALIASSLRQLLHDYAWEPPFEDLVVGKMRSSRFVRSNLILFFTSIGRSVQCLSELMELGIDDDELLSNGDAFCEKFGSLFGGVNEGFVSRDIHCCWVDVSCELEHGIGEKDRCLAGLGFVEKGIKSLGWGFCSTDAVILGNALIPFGLVYPKIGTCLIDFSFTNCDNKKNRADLVLKISDVSGNPLECKCCDLELFNLKPLNGQSDQLKTLWGDEGDHTVQISVKELWSKNDNLKLNSVVCGVYFLRELPWKVAKDQKRDDSGVFIADRVLQLLQMETTEFNPGRAVWQVFLTILYRKECSALVSISNGCGLSLMGILKPFTVHSATLFVFDGKSSTSCSMRDFNTLSSSELQIIPEKDSETPETNTQLDNLDNPLGSQQSVTSCKSNDSRTPKKLKSTKLLQNFSWSSFCKAAANQFYVDLEDVYFVKECRQSKKLKFLKCWMKQIKRSNNSFQVKEHETKSPLDIEEEIKERLTKSDQQSEQPVSSSFSSGEQSFLGSSDMNGEAVPVPCFETSEAFFNDIAQKVQLGLESEEVDLGALAERLINSSIGWLCMKHEIDNKTENSSPTEDTENCASGPIAAELSKFLLRSSKNLADKYKSSEGPSLTSHSAICTSETRVREYELQILFRMEILRSKIGMGVEETAKMKMVKQICLLLENIQCFAGGFFGDFSLDKYVGKTIKNRYSCSLGDVVSKIYNRMDLLLFDDDDGETPSSRMNSEDADDTKRERTDENEVDVNVRDGTKLSTTKASSSRSKERHVESPQKLRDKEHKRSLMKAQERRERARRFASFTSWVPDLQRVWAPKLPRPVKEKSESQKPPKKKNKRGTRYDMVCETPMTGKRRSFSQDDIGTKEQASNDFSSCSVSKALFQDDSEI
ncbi:hypothetical protein Scep_006091 [Stephania cephalantha]|uniref:Treslin n=1 Tax=Stephania cephalantha TaxID=152367 RepID=A0AAP0K986_9MAGN